MTTKLLAEHLDVHYGEVHALKDVNIAIGERRLTSLIGPSGCGKSTLLRVFNRMNDLVPGCRIDGRVELDGRPLYGRRMDVEALRPRQERVVQRRQRLGRQCCVHHARRGRPRGLGRGAQAR